MSAIFGIINKNGEAVDEGMVAKMQESLLHRAIDGKNVVTKGGMMFGHHKLIVHRRQTKEQQPFEYEDHIITCDARIDNIVELAKELNLISSADIADSFIIIQAFKKWGNDCVKFLDGEFTFAIWNKTTKIFYAASDHIGFRTFYYYQNSNIFAFASEIKALENIKTEPLVINKEIFFGGYTIVHQPITYDKNIHVLQSAHYIRLNRFSRLRKKKYWQAKQTNKYKFNSSNEWHKCIVDQVTNKIKCQIDTDYPVGILLSGGLDSSFVAAIACTLLKKENKKLIAFSTVLPENYKGEDKDERLYIEKLKEYYDNLEVHYLSIPAEIGPYNNLEAVFEKVESPVNMFYYADINLYKNAKQLNVRTLLTGFGGDMTISHPGDGVIFQYLSQFKLLRACRAFIKRHKETKRTLYNHFKHEVLSHIYLLKIAKGFFGKNNNYPSLTLKKDYLKKIVGRRYARNYMYNTSYAQRLNTGEIGSMLLLIRKLSNSYQQEFLSPLLSKEITDLFMDLPGEELYLNGKYRSLIKGAMAGIVPKEIIDRNDKMPFSPDSNERIANIKVESIAHLLKNKQQIENYTGIDLELLAKSIAQISHTDRKTVWLMNKKTFFIPIVVIAAEFYVWISNKLTSHR